MIGRGTVDTIAEIWREIGQPPIDGLIFVISSNCGLDGYESILGIPVYYTNSIMTAICSSIAVCGDVEISKAFDKAANGKL